MSLCWIVRRPNGGDGPYLVFLIEEDAKAARDLIEKVSGERPLIIEAELMQRRK